MAKDRYSSAYISSATTTVVKTGAGLLHTITISETAAGAISIYDGLTAGGTLKAVIKASVAEQTFFYDIEFSVGLTIVTAAASKLTVSFN